MHSTQDSYFEAYRSLRFTRDSQGVLLAEFHSNRTPLTFTAPDHTDFVDAFYRISQDRANKVVILSGMGGEFIPSIDFSSFGNVARVRVVEAARNQKRGRAATNLRRLRETRLSGSFGFETMHRSRLHAASSRRAAWSELP